MQVLSVNTSDTERSRTPCYDSSQVSVATSAGDPLPPASVAATNAGLPDFAAALPRNGAAHTPCTTHAGCDIPNASDATAGAYVYDAAVDHRVQGQATPQTRPIVSTPAQEVL